MMFRILPIIIFMISIIACQKGMEHMEVDLPHKDTSMVDTMIVIVDTMEVERPDPTAVRCNCSDTTSAVYIESEGLISIEAESGDYLATKWQKDSAHIGYNSTGYLVWEGDDYFNDPGKGLISYRIRVSTPGTYRFVWNSRITSGTSNTDSNDTWLRIPDAKHFYGKRDSDGHIVYPKGTNQEPIAASSGQASAEVMGAGKQGWFKVYMNKVGEWQWRSTTSDNDPHQIYAVFHQAGDYTIQLSGRSKDHGIDKFIMYNDTYSLFTASNPTNLLSQVVCE